MTPHPHHPTSSILHCYPLPIHHPFPQKKNFDHTPESFIKFEQFGKKLWVFKGNSGLLPQTLTEKHVTPDADFENL